ncbi:Contig_38, whole genome shotgun sequence [Microbacterium sp. 8M]|uniref:GNAT family N-acetyltransferase n=1 Tax=Microbacterium sp. 8M TaxID=2653153 RepID=UPI0012EFE06E|nr:GNAT family N-acetyltransferase [Microbacterium sp. 8M]VXB12680.1 Contig_38, whole genome shotgun sequence [Microbacterium sp. 8M]
MAKRKAVLYCDAAPGVGLGHLMRCLALAQVARARGWEADVVGDIDPSALAAAARVAPDVVVRSRPVGPGELSDAADVLHLDTYADLPDLRSGRHLLSNMQDGAFGARSADLVIDGTLGAERSFRVTAEDGAARLVGIDAAVIRQQVLRQRDRAAVTSHRPRVLVVMGGTDPQGATAAAIAALSAVGTSIDVTVVDTASWPEVRAAAAASPHRIEIRGFVDDLPALAGEHDFVVTAAGTSVWDYACMGLPMALVCVVDNQRDGYREAVAGGLALGLGEPKDIATPAAVSALEAILRDPDERARQRERLRCSVDGLGAWRIVSAWEQLLEVPVRKMPGKVLTARRARMADADLLREWRNDAVTRAYSRTQGEIDRAAHVEWLRSSLGSPDRTLLVVEDDGEPVGTVRWDRDGRADWIASITVAPQQRGRGIAASVLAAGEEAIADAAPMRFLADIREDNSASRRLFARAGYLPQLPADAHGYARYAKWRFLAGPGLRADPR